MRGDKNTTNNNHQSTEQIKESLEAYQKGGVKNSIGNCVKVLKSDPKLQGAIAKNLLTERVDIVKPLWWKRTGFTITDTDMNYLLLYLEENYGLTNENKALKAIDIVANENCYHPIRDYLDQLQWDGKERIRYALHRFLGSEESEYNYQALKLFMLGAIHRAFHPGCKFETMLCLVGGQGAGKSTFFRFMAIRDEWFSDDLRKLDDENVYRKLQGHRIIEMSEMIASLYSMAEKGTRAVDISVDSRKPDKQWVSQCLSTMSTNNSKKNNNIPKGVKPCRFKKSLPSVDSRRLTGACAL